VETLCSKLSLAQITALVKVLEKKDPEQSKKAFYAEVLCSILGMILTLIA
jgi:hypothetical protein